MENYIQQGPYFVGFTKGFDHRNSPELSKYGQHPATLWVGCKGEAGAIELEICTGWPVKDRVNFFGYVEVRAHSELSCTSASEPDYHITDGCHLLEGRACVCTYTNYSGYDLRDIAKRNLDELFQLVKELYEEHYKQPLERSPT